MDRHYRQPTTNSKLTSVIDPRISLDILGRWEEGGVAQFFDQEELYAVVELPPAEWAVLALLAEAARHSDSPAPERTRWAAAFVAPNQLARELKQRTRLLAPTGDNVIKFVYKLRRLVDQARPSAPWIHTHPANGIPAAGDGSWSKQLIEHRRYLGYRIGLAPSRLCLQVIDELNPADLTEPATHHPPDSTDS